MPGTDFAAGGRSMALELSQSKTGKIGRASHRGTATTPTNTS
jgi:hypothetical protein